MPLPQLAHYELKDITTAELDDWLYSLQDTQRLSDCQSCSFMARRMLEFATRKGYIKHSPALECERMVGGGRARGILTIAEAREVFDERNIDRLWRGNVVMFAANLLGHPRVFALERSKGYKSSMSYLTMQSRM